MVVIDREGHMTSSRPLRETQRAHCIFEHIYFARPDSFFFGANVGTVRHKLGEELAREAPAEADLVMPVPDSATGAALGFAHASGIPFDMGLIRNHYVGRTFIEPEQQIRDFGARVKYNPVRGVLDGKRVVVMEDSIVRGTTMRKIVHMLKAGGAAEIHMRISSAPLRNPCFYGIDIPTREELVAATHSVEELRKFFLVDSLHYLSIEGMVRASGLQKDKYCMACFDGEYPVMDQDCIKDEETCLIH
jgi:amidophosphoribosyltransferase